MSKDDWKDFFLVYGWALIVVIGAIGALIYFDAFDLSNLKDDRFVNLSGLSCDEMMDKYNYCIETKSVFEPKNWHERNCDEHYISKIIDCYGESLQDQLALLNSSDIE